MLNPLELVDFITKHPSFSGPVAVWIFYQILKITLAQWEKQWGLVWISINSVGAEINIICIPILLTNFGDQKTQLCLKYGSVKKRGHTYFIDISPQLLRVRHGGGWHF
jgi:hypothetical protein